MLDNTHLKLFLLKFNEGVLLFSWILKWEAIHIMSPKNKTPVQGEKKWEKPVLMHFVKQSNYREREMKATSEKELAKKAMRAIKDWAKYMQKKIGLLENEIKELKSELRKSSKKKKNCAEAQGD